MKTFKSLKSKISEFCIEKPTKPILFFGITLIALGQVSQSNAQFAPERSYTNLYYDNRIKAEVKLKNLFVSCQKNSEVGSFKILREAGRSSTVVSQGILLVSNCRDAADDGEGFIFRESSSIDGSLCEGRLQLFDQVWHFDKARLNQNCYFKGRSYYIPTNRQ